MPKEQFIIAMRFLASSVSIISTKDQSGNLYSMTASSVTSLTMDPPSILVCVNNGARIHDVLTKGENYVSTYFKRISKKFQIYAAQGLWNQKDLITVFGM